MVLDNVLLKKIEGFKQFVANMIPIAGNHTPSSDTTNGSSGTNMDYARSDHTHPKSNLYAESVHTHSQYLTTHQDISGKLNIAQTSYKGKNVVVDNTTGNITFEDKPTVPQASTSSPLADMTGGAIGSDSKYAKADHQHPKSTLYAEANHTHSDNDVTVTTTNYGSGLSQNEFNNYLSYDMIQVKNKLDSVSTMAPSAHTHGNLQNDGRVGTSDNASKNVVTDGNGKITTEAKITMVDTVQDGNSNAVTSNAVYDYVNSVIGDADDWLTS